MSNTSGTFNFQKLTVELLIRDAFENIGIPGEFIEPQKLESAKRSINLLLIEWINKSVNLWTLKTDFITLKEGVGSYQLPIQVSDLIQANIRSSTRQLGGTPMSASGIAANAFDSNPNTSCVITGSRGYVGYDFGAGNDQSITMVGINSHRTLDFVINIEYSHTNTNENAWKTLQATPVYDYQLGVIKWYSIASPISARYIRIKEMAARTGAHTLNIQELYFNNNTSDIPISNLSRYDYLSYPQKELKGRPTSYYVDRAISPILNIWPTPSNEYNCLQYSCKEMLEDVGKYNNNIEVPARFYPAMIAGLSFKLALKYKPEMAEFLERQYEKLFDLATIEDTENSVITIRGDYR